MAYVPAVLLALLAYGLGSIPFGLLMGRWHGLDIREHGSRNIGATNVWRVLGWRVGLTTFLCDMGKGLLAVLLAKGISPTYGHDPSAIGILAASACLLGHTFPIWLRFRGGKGVATSIGVLFALVPLPALLTFSTWGLILKLTRYVSLASILAALALPMYVLLQMMFGTGLLRLEGWGNFYFAVAAALMVNLRHIPNMKRLLAGTESRFGPGAPEGNPPGPEGTAEPSSSPASQP